MINWRIIIQISVVFTTMGFVFAEVEPDDELSKYNQRKYQRDATRLALRLVSESPDYSEESPEIPQDLVTSIYDALKAVHLSNLEPARLVTRKHKLHTFPVPNVDRFFVVYKRNASWATPLRLGDNTTESEKINNLCKQFGLIIENNVEWDEEHNSFHIRAERSLNIAPIAKDFLQIEGVTLVDLLTPNGDGNDIQLRKIAEGWQLDYMIKFDSCITGCKQRHTWSFKVDRSGAVEFIGESGDELPEWMLESD